MQLTGMNLVLGRNLGDRFLFFQHLEHHLGFECRGMMFLFRHDVSSITLEALQTCLVFGDHYRPFRRPGSFAPLPMIPGARPKPTLRRAINPDRTVRIFHVYQSTKVCFVMASLQKSHTQSLFPPSIRTVSLFMQSEEQILRQVRRCRLQNLNSHPREVYNSTFAIRLLKTAKSVGVLSF